MPGQPAEAGRYGRRNPLGQYREIAAVQFRDYELTIKSPQECPALGDIELKYGSVVERGPIDHAVWQRLGTIIRERELARVKYHGERNPEHA